MVITAIVGLIGVIIGAIIGLIPYFMERKERYKLEEFKNDLERGLEKFKKDLEIKYEVRIKTHQEAFAWLLDLSVALNSGDEAKMHEVANQARNWWNRSCFFLDKNSRGKFMTLTNRAHMFAGERESGVVSDPDAQASRREIWGLLDETINSVQDGIKVERLDVLETPEKKKGD